MRYEACVPLLSFAAALVVTGALVRSRWARLALDHPNHRSLHDVPIPRVGGVGILVGVAIAFAIADAGAAQRVVPGLALLAAVSLLDDVRGLRVSIRLAMHLAAAGMFAVAVHSEIGPLAAIMLTLGTAWMINLYNFMDGSDGLAAGMTVFGFSFYGAAAWLAGAESYALLNFGIAAAAAGFLYFNFHPARVFMGDSGAVPLGFLAAVLGLTGWQREYWTWWFPVLVFSPFIVDATITLARRVLRRERVWEAHADHYYQRLVRMGWGHRNTALAEYALMLVCGFAALGALGATPPVQFAVLTTSALVYAALALFVDRAWLRVHVRSTA